MSKFTTFYLVFTWRRERDHGVYSRLQTFCFVKSGNPYINTALWNEVSAVTTVNTYIVSTNIRIIQIGIRSRPAICWMSTYVYTLKFLEAKILAAPVNHTDIGPTTTEMIYLYLWFYSSNHNIKERKTNIQARTWNNTTELLTKQTGSWRNYCGLRYSPGRILRVWSEHRLDYSSYWSQSLSLQSWRMLY